MDNKKNFTSFSKMLRWDNFEIIRHKYTYKEHNKGEAQQTLFFIAFI